MSEITYDDFKQRLDTLDHNSLAAIERMNSMHEKVDEIRKQLGTHQALLNNIGVAQIGETGVSDSGLIGTDKPEHMVIGEVYLGKHERHDKDILTKFLGVDPVALYWCAYYVGSCYEKAGMKSAGGTASSYKSIGNKIKYPVFGCMCIWENHIAFFYGYADKTKLGLLEKYGRVNSLGDWEKVRCEKDDPNAVIMVMGGNQSDTCNVSPKEFYDNYTEFDGYFEYAA